MSDLTDALTDKVVLETEGIIHYTAPSLVQKYLDVVAAARRVAEAPEVWWCEVHDNSYYSPGRCYGGRWSGGCRMVRKLLVDPDNL